MRAADERACPARHAGEHVEDRGAGDELARKQRQRAEPDERRRHAAHARCRSGTRGSRRSCRSRASLASRQSRGATKNANTSEPRPADPTHHHALRPSR